MLATDVAHIETNPQGYVSGGARTPYRRQPVRGEFSPATRPVGGTLEPRLRHGPCGLMRGVNDLFALVAAGVHLLSVLLAVQASCLGEAQYPLLTQRTGAVRGNSRC